MRVDLPFLHILDFHLMMIYDGHILSRQTCYIAGTVLTVHSNQQSRRFTCRFLLRICPDISYINNGNIQLIHHQQQI